MSISNEAVIAAVANLQAQILRILVEKNLLTMDDVGEAISAAIQGAENDPSAEQMKLFYRQIYSVPLV